MLTSTNTGAFFKKIESAQNLELAFKTQISQNELEIVQRLLRYYGKKLFAFHGTIKTDRAV